MNVLSMEHTGIAARNPKSLADFYIEALGFRLVRQASETTFFIGCGDGGILEIYQAKEGGADARTNYAQGIRHIALTVSDFDEALAGLLAMGIEQAAPVHLDPPALRLALFRDPEGNLFHITRRDQPLEV